MKTIATIALIFATVGTPATPAAARPDPCMGAQTQAQITACTDMEARLADQTVDKTYASVRRRLPARRRAALDAAQRTWVAYRDAECTSVGEAFAGGSIEATTRDACRADLDRSRLAALRWQLNPQQPLGTAAPSP